MAEAEHEEGEILAPSPPPPAAAPAEPAPAAIKAAAKPPAAPMPLPAGSRALPRAPAPAATPPPARAPFAFQPEQLPPAPPPMPRPPAPAPAALQDAARDAAEVLTPQEGEALVAAMHAEIGAGGTSVDIKLHGLVPRDDLRAALAAFGALTAFDSTPDKRRASAEFERQDDARRCVAALSSVAGVRLELTELTAALWLGNLPARATTAHLRHLFISATPTPIPPPARLFVVRAPDGRSLRYAVAEFATPADADHARRLLLACPTLSVLGRAPVAVEPTSGALRGPALHSPLLLLDFPAAPAPDDAAVRALCAPFGALLSLRVPPVPAGATRAHAWALFASPMAAISASRALSAAPAAPALRALLWNPVPPLSPAFTSPRHPLLPPAPAAAQPPAHAAPHVPLPPPTFSPPPPPHQPHASAVHTPMPPPVPHAPLPPPHMHPYQPHAPSPAPPAGHVPIHTPMPPPSAYAGGQPYGAPAAAPFVPLAPPTAASAQALLPTPPYAPQPYPPQPHYQHAPQHYQPQQPPAYPAQPYQSQPTPQPYQTPPQHFQAQAYQAQPPYPPPPQQQPYAPQAYPASAHQFAPQPQQYAPQAYQPQPYQPQPYVHASAPPPLQVPLPPPAYGAAPGEARGPLITAQTAAMAHASLRLQQIHSESVAKRGAPGAIAAPHDKKSKAAQ